MNKTDTKSYNDFREAHANDTCWLCHANKAQDAHHISGRLGETYVWEGMYDEVWVPPSGKTLIRNGKLLIALCRHCHSLAHKYLTDLRPLLLKLCLERQPELLNEGEV